MKRIVFVVSVLSLILLSSCGNDDVVIEYPVTFLFNQIEIGESKAFVETPTGVQMVQASNTLNDFQSEVNESYEFEYLGFPFDEIILKSDTELDMVVAEFTGDPQTFSLTYSIKNDSEILVDFGDTISTQFITLRYHPGDNELGLCFQSVGYISLANNSTFFSIIETDICELETMEYKRLGNLTVDDNGLVIGDTVFINYSEIVYSN